MRILGLIPARGGSMGVPRKNIKLLGGIPLINYTINSALNCPLLSDVIVSTEDEEIAEISKKSGAKVSFIRPLELASNKAPSIDTIRHAINFFIALDETYDAVCLLQPTVPFRDSNDIDKAISIFSKNDSDSLISVQEIPHKFNPHWAFLESSESDHLKLATGGDQIISRRQDLPKAFFRDGSIYITKTQTILEDNSLYGKNISYYHNKKDTINIDTLEDWALAEKFISDNER